MDCIRSALGAACDDWPSSSIPLKDNPVVLAAKVLPNCGNQCNNQEDCEIQVCNIAKGNDPMAVGILNCTFDFICYDWSYLQFNKTMEDEGCTWGAPEQYIKPGWYKSIWEQDAKESCKCADHLA